MPIMRRKLSEETFVQRLQLAMWRKEISASELARLVGVTPTAVWNWQQDNTLPRPHTLSAIADVLEVTEDYLRDGPTKVSEEISANDLSESETVAETIENLRIRIARENGFKIERVKLILELVSD